MIKAIIEMLITNALLLNYQLMKSPFLYISKRGKGIKMIMHETHQADVSGKAAPVIEL